MTLIKAFAINNTSDMTVTLKAISIAAFFILMSCSGAKDNSKGGEVIAKGDSVSTYVDKDLGATLKTASGLTLIIPKGALSESIFISMSEYRNEASTSSTIDLQPSGTKFNKALTLTYPLPKGLDEDLVEAYLFSEQGEVLEDRDETPIVELLNYTINQTILSTKISHFSQVVIYAAQPLHLIFQLPSQVLLPGDIEYNLNQGNRWMTGHARMFLGFDLDASPKEISLATGDQEFLTDQQKTDNQDDIAFILSLRGFYGKDLFAHATAANQSGVYMDDNAAFRNARSEWMYMGAKRRTDMPWQSRLALSDYIIDQEGADYFAIGLAANAEKIEATEELASFSSTSLIEEAYLSTAFGLATYDNFSNLDLNEQASVSYNSPLPVQQFFAENLTDINEMTIYEGESDGLVIPVYAALRTKENAQYYYKEQRVEVSSIVGSEFLFDNFDTLTGELDLSFIYRKDGGEPWEIKFSVEKEFSGELLSVERTLLINVNEARPIFSDDFNNDVLSDQWRSDESQINGSESVELNFLPSVLSIKTSIPDTGCDSHFLWSEELNVNRSFSIEYQFLKQGFGNSALLISTDGVKDESLDDNILEFYISSDTGKVGVNSRLSGVSTSLYEISDEEYVNIPLNFTANRIDDLFHFYINDEKVPTTFSNSALDTASSIVVGIETSSCSSGDGHGIDLVDRITVTNDAVLGFKDLAISYSQITYASDHNQQCIDEFGPAWGIADWLDLKSYFESEADMDLLIEKLDFVDRNNAWVLYEGDPSFSGTKDYFVAFHNQEKPDSFPSYDEINDDFFNLGASLTDKFVLCKRAD
jgi:hypothetical protein